MGGGIIPDCNKVCIVVRSDKNLFSAYCLGGEKFGAFSSLHLLVKSKLDTLR